jgi:hypothetical protein
MPQTVLRGLPMCGALLGGRAGRAHIAREGVTPVEWLNSFGRSLNVGVNGDADQPLPLHGPGAYTHRCAQRAACNLRSCRGEVLHDFLTH